MPHAVASRADIVREDDHACGLVRLAATAPWLILAYFALQTFSRFLVSPSLEMDEAEQLLLSQSLAWGYGPQPPLYTWLQIAVFAIVGEGVLGLALLKNGLLALTFYAAFVTVRMVSRDVVTAALASLSLFLVPQIAWEAQRDLTHSVLVLATTALTMLAFVRVCETGSRTDYAFLGLALAAGCLAKYNFVLLPVAMFAAALTLEELRPRILNRRIAITVLIVLISTAPATLWAIQHQPDALRSVQKLQMGAGTTLDVYLEGLSRLAATVGAVLWPLVLIYGTAAVGARREAGSRSGRVPQATNARDSAALGFDWIRAPAAIRPPAASAKAPGLIPQRRKIFKPRQEPMEQCRSGAPKPGAAFVYVRLLGRSLTLALLLCVGLVVVFEVTGIKDRWLLPVLYPMPLLLALWLRPRLSIGRVWLIMGAASAVALFVLVFMPARMLLEPRLGITNRLHFPAAALAEQIRARGFDDGIILSDEAFLAGNLRLAFPDSRAIVPDKPILPERIGSCWLIAWRPERGEDVPNELRTRFRSLTGRELNAEPAVIGAPVVHSAGQTARLAIVVTGCGPSPS